jgi:SPP1 family phage portal protein
MEIKEIFALATPKEVIAELKKRVDEVPEIANFDKEYLPEKHKVFDVTLRPDKKVAQTDDKPAKTEYVARIGLPMQKLIVKRAASFLFGNEPTLNAETETDNEKLVLSAMKRILYDNKTGNRNRQIARLVMRYTEAAEYWFPVKVDEHENYGFKTKFKVRQMVFSAENGNTLYPLFDDTGDMTAFSREYEIVNSGKSTKYFETWTKDFFYKWKEIEGTWEAETPIPVLIGKIPIIYVKQPDVEWKDVQTLIDRLEKLLSNFADTNDYHGSPKIFIKGAIVGFASKGESGAIIQGDANSSAEYLTWNNAPESIKTEIDTLLRMINSGTQTPDISFDSVKGIGAISGVALKLLFMDAHLKVHDQKEIYGDMLQRRVSILKSFIGVLNTTIKAEADKLFITSEIDPYIIGDDAAMIEMLSTATGGKAVISQETAVTLSGLVSDVQAEMEKLNSEAEKDNTNDLFNPTK